MGGLKYRRGSSGAISVIDENGVEYILGKNGQLIVKSSNVVESHRKSLNRAQVQALFTLGSLKGTYGQTKENILFSVARPTLEKGIGLPVEYRSILSNMYMLYGLPLHIYYLCEMTIVGRLLL